MQEVAAAGTISRAHNLAGNGSFQLRPRHLERPKTFHFSLTVFLWWKYLPAEAVACWEERKIILTLDGIIFFSKIICQEKKNR